jgi:CheY-like chemotaxis protein
LVENEIDDGLRHVSGVYERGQCLTSLLDTWWVRWLIGEFRPLSNLPGRTNFLTDGGWWQANGATESVAPFLLCATRLAKWPCLSYSEYMDLSLPSSRRVLIVEDLDDCLATMVELVSTQGCTVRVARDGASAVRVAEEFLPHVILLDLGLPVMDGYEAAAKIRANPKTQHAVIAAVSGFGMEAEIARSAAAGIDLHFIKPVAFNDLVGLLHLRGAGTD